MALHYTLLRFLRDTALLMAKCADNSDHYTASLTRFAEACEELSRFH